MRWAVQIHQLLLRCCFFHEGVQSRFLSGSGVFLDYVFFARLVEALDGEFQFFLCCFEVFYLDCFASFLDGALENTLGDFVSFGLLGGDAHVFLGGIFDRHMLSKIN